MEGKLVCQNFVVEKCIGSGQTSKIYRGINMVTKEIVAIKVRSLLLFLIYLFN
jgi:serine/threonine protein kinase